MHGCACDASFLPPSSLQASSVDSSDVTMWCQLASVSSLLGNLLMTRTALEQVQQNFTHCLASSPRFVHLCPGLHVPRLQPPLHVQKSPVPYPFSLRGEGVGEEDSTLQFTAYESESYMRGIFHRHFTATSGTGQPLSPSAQCSLPSKTSQVTWRKTHWSIPLQRDVSVPILYLIVVSSLSASYWEGLGTRARISER